MLKYAALLFNTIALLIYQFFFADGITVTQNVPSSAKPDSEFTVEITINKGTVGGFAKLQQDLPEGFTAIQDENNGASFTFTSQSVKFIWMSLPSDKEFKIRYKVKVAPGLSGDKVIGGKFSYVSDNIKQSIDIAPATVKIGEGASQPVVTNTAPTNTITPTNTTTEPANTNTTTPTNTSTEPVNTTTEPANTAANNTTAVETVNTTTPDNSTTDKAPETLTSQLVEKSFAPSETSSVTCTRNVPANVTDNFTVEIVVNKGNITGFAKLMETLPAGFTASAGETQGASFSFDASTQKVKFVWVSMPTQTEFRVSYKVSVAGVTGSQPIDGVFSYIENDETKKYVIPASTVTLGGTMANNTANTNVNTTADNTANNTAVNNTTANNTTNLSANTIPAAQGNVNYRVQIMALHKAVDANILASRYNINSKIDLEMAEGFTKYTVGSHTEYKEARDAREEIRNKGVVGPFVTAYNIGKRITVQEALMITSQKWYR